MTVTLALRQPGHRPASLLEGGLALFDLDRTLIAGSSLAFLGRELVRRKQLQRRSLVGPLLSNVAFAHRGSSDRTAGRLQDLALRTVAGLSYEGLRTAVPPAADGVCAAVYADARRLVDTHLGAGQRVVIVSAAPHELVQAVAQRMGVWRGIGTQAEVADDVLTGGVRGDFCYGAGKLARLREELGEVDLAGAHAYADSRSDLPLLQACGHPVAVNPDRALQRAARHARWPILALR